MCHGVRIVFFLPRFIHRLLQIAKMIEVNNKNKIMILLCIHEYNDTIVNDTELNRSFYKVFIYKRLILYVCNIHVYFLFEMKESSEPDAISTSMK